MCQSVGNRGDEVERDTAGCLFALSGVLDQKAERRIPYDLCSGQGTESHSGYYLSSYITVCKCASCRYGFRRQHSIVDNVRPHLGKRCVLKTDIHDFFISIRSPRVKKTFEKIGYPKNISKVLGELCCMRRHLPQGASTSPVLSNIIAYEMDRKLAVMAEEFGLTYSRYADDLTFFGRCLSERGGACPGQGNHQGREV